MNDLVHLNKMLSSTKLSSVYKSDEICLKLIKVLLWFSRIIGLTFGGLTIDSNGRLLVNKYYKIYGYLFAIVVTVYDVYHFCWSFNHGYEAKRKIFNQYLSEQMSKVLPILMTSVIATWFSLKLVMVVFFNVFGFKLVEMVVKCFKDKCQKRRNFKVIFVVIIWFTQMITLMVISALHVPHILHDYHKFMTIIEYNMVFIYSWTIASLLWIISIYTFDKLINMRKTLVNFVHFEPGKL